MPIGKNALKRVSNNGYSKVASSAPDMENSVVEPEKSETPAPVQKKSTASSKKKPADKKPEKKAEEKIPAKEPSADRDDAVAEGTAYVNLGSPLPTYLL